MGRLIGLNFNSEEASTPLETQALGWNALTEGRSKANQDFIMSVRGAKVGAPRAKGAM